MPPPRRGAGVGSAEPPFVRSFGAQPRRAVAPRPERLPPAPPSHGSGLSVAPGIGDAGWGKESKEFSQRTAGQ